MKPFPYGDPTIQGLLTPGTPLLQNLESLIQRLILHHVRTSSSDLSRIQIGKATRARIAKTPTFSHVLYISPKVRTDRTGTPNINSEGTAGLIFALSRSTVAKSPRSQLCLKVVRWGKKELLAKYPRSQLCLKVVCWVKKELLDKSPRSQLCLKLVCWGKKELLESGKIE
uniref:Uncharacterized protein n=1 Tax=Timema tahoe TaxID=61484 RepID=A0A7R9FGN2_9NEOP|nr:unnamed protein product [Timema tahoe]